MWRDKWAGQLIPPQLSKNMEISEGYTALLGLPEGTTEIARSKWLSAVHPADVEQMQALWNEVFRQRRRECNAEFCIVRSGGEVRWVEKRSLISYDGDGQPQRVAALDGCIESMATTHELLSDRRWQRIPLAELVHRELAPNATASNTRIDGPDVVLSAEAGQTLAMVFHEFATNAAKFGAISVKSGRVSVRWSFRRNGHAESRLCRKWAGRPPS